ncbi:MAG: sulfotransferase family 2 domain-containing protein [Verrucomicrobiae bacterium]|nr:sulfotransferase family 2 domain-containing protein [Verrucomicrobiae bacterium]MCB1087301.1 sulfotransferase family 2 domain-containing protein [Verrucomicrobiae bacterium]MCB1091557.1 sulfotransferase family 2 domain-containing protein [Verrucomicrobiae bacterium]
MWDKAIEFLKTIKAWWNYRLLPRFRRDQPENRRVLHAYRCVFVHIPKTAGSSIARALDQLPLRNGPDHPVIDTPKHAKARELRRILGRKRWNDYFTFAIVRNPWDLMVSCYEWWMQKADRFPHIADQMTEVRSLGSFEAFLRSPWGMERINQFNGNIEDWFMDGDEQIVDFIARFENLDHDWPEICRHIGVEPFSIAHENKTDRRDYRSYYTDETRELVARRFARTIERFGYEF